MRRIFRALACLGGLVALMGTQLPAAQAQAHTQTQTQARPSAGAADCRILVSRPAATTTSIRSRVLRTGCTQRTRVRVAIKVSRPGPDKTVRKVKKVLRNGRIAISVRCTATPRRYYVVISDGFGNRVRSKSARLTCADKPAAPPAEQQNPPVESPNPPAQGSAVGTAAEEEVVRLTNQARQRNGCAPLVHDPQLRAAALGHSRDMAARDFFSHTSPEGRSPGDRIRAAGFSPIRSWGENIAVGQPTAAVVVQAWLDSPGHRANILNCGFTHIGVGQAQGARGIYWTQNFASH